MVCDSGCRTKCTTADAGSLYVSNVIVSPSTNPNPSDYVTVQADIKNDFPISIAVRLCVYDDDTGQCIASTGETIQVAFLTQTYGPITIGQMGNRQRRIQVAAVQTTIPFTKYDCGQWVTETLTPYFPPGQTCDCTNGGCVAGTTMDCGVCSTTCTGGSTCKTSSDCGTGNMCLLGQCIPSALIFIAFAGIIYSMTKD